MEWVDVGRLAVAKHCAVGTTRLALILALSIPAWSSPNRLPDSPQRWLDTASRWSATGADEGDGATTPILDEALRPAEIGYALVLDDVFKKKANDVDAALAWDDARPREYMSAKATAKLSQLLFRLTAEVSSSDIAIETSAVEWSAPAFASAAGNGPVIGSGQTWSGFGPVGDAAAAGEPQRNSGSQTDAPEGNPLFRFLSTAFQYLRDNREWVLGIAAGLAALAGLASSMQARR